MIYSSDGEVYEDATQHQLDVPNVSTNASEKAPVMSSEDVKSMTHEKSEGKLQTPLLTHLSNKLLETNKTIGDLMTGRLDVNSPEGARAAVDLAFKTAGYGMLGAEMSAYNKGLGIFGGRMSQAARFTAEQMEKSSKFSAEDIKRWTGLERGAEGMWRNEMSDYYTKLNIPATFHQKFVEGELQSAHVYDEGKYLAGDIIEHPEFFKAYPEAKNLSVEITGRLQKGNEGLYTSSYKGADPKIELSRFNSPEKMHTALIHELQHYIQEKEGFAFGHDYDIAKYEQDVAARLKQEVPEFFEKQTDKYKVYRALADEVEAFNTGNRMILKPNEISKSLGKDTEDIVRQLQLVLKGKSGEQSAEYSKYSKLPPENIVDKIKEEDLPPSRPFNPKEPDERKKLFPDPLKDRPYETPF